MKSIATIASELRTSNPELGNPTARDLNDMLLVKQLICVVPDGKSPTQLGIQKGIQRRTNLDDQGRLYCYPVYNEEAERYVKNLAITYFAPNTAPIIEPDSEAINESASDTTPVYKYSHKDFEEVQNQHRDRLVLLEGPYSYWTYFQDARTISQVMNWDIYENRRSIPGLTFSKEQLGTVLQELDYHGISWIVSEATGYRTSQDVQNIISIEDPIEDVGVVEVGSYVKVRINGTIEKSFLISDENNDGHIIYIDGTTGVVNRVEYDASSIESLSIQSSPAARALLGHRVGDIVNVPGGTGEMNVYQILSIK